MYSNQYYYNNNTIPTHSRSSYNLQQYASANAQSNNAHAMQPQPISHSSRSLSHSNYIMVMHIWKWMKCVTSHVVDIMVWYCIKE